MAANICILVVDDQPALRASIGLTLELAGYMVAMATDGVEAIEVLQARRVDLIIADIAMPRMDGHELCRQVRMHPHWGTLPFLFLSARAREYELGDDDSPGPTAYLLKPIQPEDLLSAVLHHLELAQPHAA
jgi:twitching motility two-component system response regulator PilH